jgi:hypothetical protein
MIARVVVIVCTAVNEVLVAGHWAIHEERWRRASWDSVGRLLDSDGVRGRHAEEVSVAVPWALYEDDRKEM